MAQWHLRRFTDPAVLDSIRPQLLHRFLAPYRDYLEARGVPSPSGPGDAFDPEALLAALADPGDDMPPDLMNALFLVDESASPEAADALRDAARARGLPLDPDQD